MVVLDGTTIFWLIAIGMVTGALAKFAMGKSTIDLVPNVLAGVAGSVVVGSIVVLLELPGDFLFALLGSICILFIVNVFHQEREDEHLELEKS